jgi:hypothetical protein
MALHAAARSGDLPPGWVSFGLFVGDSEAARLAVGMHVVSSCVVQRRVAELGRDAHHWLDSLLAHSRQAIISPRARRPRVRP